MPDFEDLHLKRHIKYLITSFHISYLLNLDMLNVLHILLRARLKNIVKINFTCYFLAFLMRDSQSLLIEQCRGVRWSLSWGCRTISGSWFGWGRSQGSKRL